MKTIILGILILSSINGFAQYESIYDTEFDVNQQYKIPFKSVFPKSGYHKEVFSFDSTIFSNWIPRMDVYTHARDNQINSIVTYNWKDKSVNSLSYYSNITYSYQNGIWQSKYNKHKSNTSNDTILSVDSLQRPDGVNISKKERWKYNPNTGWNREFGTFFFYDNLGQIKQTIPTKPLTHGALYGGYYEVLARNAQYFPTRIKKNIYYYDSITDVLEDTGDSSIVEFFYDNQNRIIKTLAFRLFFTQETIRLIDSVVAVYNNNVQQYPDTIYRYSYEPNSKKLRLQYLEVYSYHNNGELNQRMSYRYAYLFNGNLTVTPVEKIIYSAINVGLHDVENDLSLALYPNPCSETAYIDLPIHQMSKAKVFITNSAGVTVYDGTITTPTIHVKELKLTDGLYYLQVLFNNQLYKGKLLINNK
ncbi:MAG: T9SS C-terminal target domain-containing protein [Bacteroidetes bacterium]|nr:MAG: T9SS C-terminal target domain-containing protein [Bacteroidota bacterium]